MQHTIPLAELQAEGGLPQGLGPQVTAMAGAIEACVHCGFCLPVCPTYQILGQEMDSPRGRILLMKSVLEGNLPIEDAFPYVDRCLGCQACVTACPSGVRYGELLSPFRAYIQAQITRSTMQRLQRKLVNSTLPYPRRFRSAALLGRFARPLSNSLPEELQSMLDLLPERLPQARSLPVRIPAEGTQRARVALLVGCVQRVLAPEINWATLRVLAKNGVEVIIPPGQACCGAILMHTGDEEGARRLARQNLHAFAHKVDAIVTNAAGCGSGMKEYGLLFKGLEEETQALAFTKQVRDVSQFLAELGLIDPPALPQPMRVAYHDACHLAHAQGVTEAPRRLLTAIPNLTLLEIADSGMCCGSAGTYNIEQPAIASELGQQKTKNILDSGGEAVVTGNIGCMVQIRSHLASSGKLLPVFHTIEVLDMAYSRMVKADRERLNTGEN